MSLRTRTWGVLALQILCGISQGSASAYEWTVTHPDGRVTEGEGDHMEWRPLMPGDHTVELTVRYQHEDSANPGEPYVAHATEIVPVTGADLRRVFVDGFETGTTGEWSKTQGGSDE